MLRNAEFTQPENGPSPPPTPARGPVAKPGDEHGGPPWFKRGVEPGRAPAGVGREPVGCVELAMTHRSASRCVFATHPTCWRPGKRGLPATFPWHLFSRPTPHAPRRRPSGPAGSGHEQTLPRWLLPDADTRIGKERTESDLDDRPLSLVWHQTGRSRRQKRSVCPRSPPSDP